MSGVPDSWKICHVRWVKWQFDGLVSLHSSAQNFTSWEDKIRRIHILLFCSVTCWKSELFVSIRWSPKQRPVWKWCPGRLDCCCWCQSLQRETPRHRPPWYGRAPVSKRTSPSRRRTLPKSLHSGIPSVDCPGGLATYPTTCGRWAPRQGLVWCERFPTCKSLPCRCKMSCDVGCCDGSGDGVPCPPPETNYGFLNMCQNHESHASFVWPRKSLPMWETVCDDDTSDISRLMVLPSSQIIYVSRYLLRLRVFAFKGNSTTSEGFFCRFFFSSWFFRVFHSSH